MAVVMQEGHSLASAVGLLDPVLVVPVRFDHNLVEHSCHLETYLAGFALGRAADFVVEVEDTVAVAGH